LREGAVRLVAIPGQRNAIAEIAAEAAIFRIAVHVRARQAPGRMASADAVEMDVTVHADTATRGQPTANRKAIKIGIDGPADANVLTIEDADPISVLVGIDLLPRVDPATTRLKTID